MREIKAHLPCAREVSTMLSGTSDMAERAMTHSSRQSTLGDLLNRMTVAGELYFAEGEQKVRCVACGHRCPIPEGRAGVCKVRYNSGGKLFVPHGYASGIHPDPIEKKPFFHVLPGSLAMSFG
ncbi:MAG: hypothetical protein COZ56_11905, partial [Armatimonadetes bacterium CG_4_8_14_3_um_filter_58_9]